MRWTRRAEQAWELAVVAAVCSCLIGCDQDDGEGRVGDPEPEFDKVAGIPVSKVSGTLATQRFELKDARFKIDRRAGYERIDLELSGSAAKEKCGALEDSGSPAVWIRFPGVSKLEPGELRRQPGKPASFEVHMKVRRDGQWFGNGDSAALLVVEIFEPGVALNGVLSVCFGDPDKSCVSGTFVAASCPDMLDVPPRSFGPATRGEIARIRAELEDAGVEHEGASGPADSGSSDEISDSGPDGGGGAGGGDEGIDDGGTDASTDAASTDASTDASADAK